MKHRIEYIDALRGFTMILVVFVHVEMFGIFGHINITPLNTLFQTIHMPLFFFISGIIAYSSTKEWNRKAFGVSLWKKCRVLLPPALICGLLYTYLVVQKDVFLFVLNPAKQGYWFTIVLLEMFLIYYIVNQFVFYRKNTTKSQFNDTLWCALLIGLAVVMYVAKVPFKMNPTLCVLGDITSLHFTFNFFQFFVFGLMAAHFKPYFELLLTNKYVCAFVVLAFFIGWFLKTFYVAPHETAVVDMWKCLATLLDTICGYLGVVLVYGFFVKHQVWFSSHTYTGRRLQGIGRRTLDIYLLHYFFLPTLPMVGTFLSLYPNVVVELCIGGIISLLVIGCSLVVSELLRMSDYLAYWLFGTPMPSDK